MTAASPTLRERFESKGEQGPKCWRWTGSKTRGGYGVLAKYFVKSRGFNTTAHRIAYELHVGPIPDGLEIDHLCANRECANPEHLEAVTHQENERRKHLRNPPQTSFRCGHPFEESNWYVLTNGSRYCRICQLVRCKRRNKGAK